MNVLRIRPCPHCRKPALWEGNPWRPFCSERCRMIDLGNWATGEYSIPYQPDALDTDIARPQAEDDTEAS